jgi:hypothetical protein
MTKIVDSEPPKTISELTHVQRWEDDGGAMSSEGNQPISRVAETSTPQSMGVEKNDLLFGELNNTHSKGDKQMNPFVFFLASNTGRIVRIMGGFALVVLGRFGFSGTTSLVVMFIGVVPLLASTFDLCLLAPLFGTPMSGPKIRAGKTT